MEGSLPARAYTYAMGFVDWAVVQWDDDVVPLRNVEQVDDGDFYALISGVREGRRWGDIRLMYIGSAYRQHVAKRIKQEHASYARLIEFQALHKDQQLLVMTGGLSDQSVSRVTERFVLDVEALLIYRNKPRFNTKRSYTGRRLVVENEGDFTPLRPLSACCSDCLSDWRNQ